MWGSEMVKVEESVRKLSQNPIKSLIETGTVVLTFAAWFPIVSAGSGLKGEQRL